MRAHAGASTDASAPVTLPHPDDFNVKFSFSTSPSSRLAPGPRSTIKSASPPRTPVFRGTVSTLKRLMSPRARSASRLRHLAAGGPSFRRSLAGLLLPGTRSAVSALGLYRCCSLRAAPQSPPAHDSEPRAYAPAARSRSLVRLDFFFFARSAEPRLLRERATAAICAGAEPTFWWWGARFCFLLPCCTGGGRRGSGARSGDRSPSVPTVTLNHPALPSAARPRRIS